MMMVQTVDFGMIEAARQTLWEQARVIGTVLNASTIEPSQRDDLSGVLEALIGVINGFGGLVESRPKE
jgi:hypothetical protein